jgi:hypothetical protein
MSIHRHPLAATLALAVGSALLSLTLAQPAAAQESTPELSAKPTPTQRMDRRIDRRQAHQQRRIEQGEHSGALTAREADRLEKQQAGTQRQEARIEADGKITSREAHRMERHQDRTSRYIVRQKHDPQQQP